MLCTQETNPPDLAPGALVISEQALAQSHSSDGQVEQCRSLSPCQSSTAALRFPLELPATHWPQEPLLAARLFISFRAQAAY
jgi:hypothetical protein